MHPLSAHADPWRLNENIPLTLPSGRQASPGERGQRKEKKMREQIEKALERIRPALQADGGDVELVDVAEGVVKVRLKGACGG